MHQRRVDLIHPRADRRALGPIPAQQPQPPRHVEAMKGLIAPADRLSRDRLARHHHPVNLELVLLGEGCAQLRQPSRKMPARRRARQPGNQVQWEIREDRDAHGEATPTPGGGAGASPARGTRALPEPHVR